jgi:GAF domain-containing protein
MPAQPAASEETPETKLVRRLHGAVTSIRELEDLLQELPMLEDLWAMADALAGELETVFEATIATVFVRADDGFHAVAHRGLSRVEAGMIVPETQPLFSDVLRTGEGILIQPVDLAQGLVAGIGGARTEAIMAAPAILEGERVAIIVVGRDGFNEADLDTLSDLATEAAPGIAVAHLLHRLRGRPSE